MDIASLDQLFLRPLVAVLLAGILGWERGTRDKPAGLRTHMMVALGSATIWVVGAIGVACGTGHYLAGVYTALLAFFILTVVERFERRVMRPSHSPGGSTDGEQQHPPEPPSSPLMGDQTHDDS